MGTRKSVDKILDQAADILEKRGFTTGACYNPDTGGYCALGAIARAAYPRAKNAEIDTIAYYGIDGRVGDADEFGDPRYVDAVERVVRTIHRVKKPLNADDHDLAYEVYRYNDDAKSPQQVVKMLRRAAEQARKAKA